MSFLDLRAGHADLGIVEIEIGCGNGHFLAEYAARLPGVHFIGIDIKKKRCLKAEEKAVKRRLANVSVERARADEFLQGVPPGSVDAFHVYFPDPWPKSKHRKRRLLSRENLNLLHDRLKPGGRLFFGTDFLDYFVQVKLLLILHGGFSLTGDPVPGEAISSIFSRKTEAKNKTARFVSAASAAHPTM